MQIWEIPKFWDRLHILCGICYVELETLVILFGIQVNYQMVSGLGSILAALIYGY